MKRNNRIKDYYFPALYSEDLGTIAIAIDTSGSIDNVLYNRFCSEINGLREKYKFKCIVLSCDSAITGSRIFSKYQKIDFSFVEGGGGTRFTPVFNWIQKNTKGIIGLIYFTDLQCSDYPSTIPPHDTVWMNYDYKNNEYRVEPPFGKTVDMRT